MRSDRNPRHHHDSLREAWMVLSILFLAALAPAKTDVIEFAYFIEPQAETAQPQSFRASLSPDMGMSSLGVGMGLTLALTMPTGPSIRFQAFALGDFMGENSMQGEAATVGYSFPQNWGWMDFGAGPLWAKTRHSDLYTYYEYRNGYGFNVHAEAVRAFRFAGLGVSLDWRYMPGNFNLTSATILIPLGRLQ